MKLAWIETLGHLPGGGADSRLLMGLGGRRAPPSTADCGATTELKSADRSPGRSGVAGATRLTEPRKLASAAYKKDAQ